MCSIIETAMPTLSLLSIKLSILKVSGRMKFRFEDGNTKAHKKT